MKLTVARKKLQSTEDLSPDSPMRRKQLQSALRSRLPRVHSRAHVAGTKAAAVKREKPVGPGSQGPSGPSRSVPGHNTSPGDGSKKSVGAILKVSCSIDDFTISLSAISLPPAANGALLCRVAGVGPCRARSAGPAGARWRRR